MATQVIQVLSDDFQNQARDAGQVLDRGGLVVFPTETVYGLGARADLPAAMARLREVKGRDVQQGFTVHLAHRDQANLYVEHLPVLALRLMRKAWPGPLTLLLKVDDPEQAKILKGRDASTRDAIYYHKTVGLRCPDDQVARAVLEAARGPVVAASANLAGHHPPRTAADALSDLEGQVDLVLDAGGTRYARASTIVRVMDKEYEVVREGVLDAGIIERMSVAHILFVCSGNTCRSPMAAGLARKLIAERLDCKVEELEQHGVKVTSAGTSGGMGPASSGALKAMSDRGVDLSGHHSTALTPDLIRQADHIFVMTKAHRDAVLSMVPWAQSKTSLLLGSEDVEDPVGASDEQYDQCARTIERGLIERLQEVPI